MTSWSTVRPYFERSTVVHLATLMRDGGPNSVPVWVGVEGEGELLSIFVAEGSRKDRNLQRDPRLALSVTHPDEPLDMATVRGRAVERLTGDAAMAVIDRISQAYTGGPYRLRSGLTAFLVAPDHAWANEYSG